MLMEEMQQDRDFAPALLNLPESTRDEKLLALVRRYVGLANGQWKKKGGSAEGAAAPKLEANPLPWSSIDHYPEWVVDQIKNYAEAELPVQASARQLLEHA